MKTQEEIISMIKEIAHNLTDYNRLLELVTSESNVRHMSGIEFSAWKAERLSHGLPALCMLYGELNEQFPGENWDVEGHKYLGELVQQIKATGIHTPSMFSGAAGIGLSALCMSSNLSKYTKFIQSINEYIIYSIPQILDIKTDKGAIISLYDAIEGVSGITSYLLQFKEQSEIRDIIIKSIRFLIDITQEIEYKGNSVPGWLITSENLFTDQERELYPNGNFNTSISHGISGIICILSQALLDGVEVKGQEEAIKKMIDFLLKFEQKDDCNHAFWKGQISYEEFIAGKPSNDNIVRRDAWCYGNIGIAYAFVCAGKALMQQEYIDKGIGVLRETSMDIKGIFSPTFCHGYSGILQVLNAVERLIGECIFSQEKEYIKEKILSYYEEEYIYKFYNIEIDREVDIRKFEYIGLLDGITGVCLALLNNEIGSKTPWNKAFLLY